MDLRTIRVRVVVGIVQTHQTYVAILRSEMKLNLERVAFHRKDELDPFLFNSYERFVLDGANLPNKRIFSDSFFQKRN